MSLLSTFRRLRRRRTTPAPDETSGRVAGMTDRSAGITTSGQEVSDVEREIQAIDVALSSRHIVDDDEHRLSNDEYWQWRKRMMMRRANLAQRNISADDQADQTA